MKAKYVFIRGEEGNYPISWMCRWARVSASGYYHWRSRPLSATARRREELTALITHFFEASDATEGYRRIHARLARHGYSCDPHTVRSIMREAGLVAVQPRRTGPRTTVQAADAHGVPDLVGRDFTAVEPARKLVGDITYVGTAQGWAYLATVLDCHTKKCVGYAIAEHMRTSLVTDALAMAARNGYVRRDITVFHSDRGTQYMSQEFADFADCHGITRSVGRTGICFDNAWAESFNATLKVERVHRMRYATCEEAASDIAWFIELRYNQNRLHSSLGYLTPNEVEQAWRDSLKAA